MKVKHIFLLALLVAVISTQITDLNKILQDSKAANKIPQPVIQVAQAVNIRPVKIPVTVTKDEEEFDPTDDPKFVPCGKEESCGEAKSFSSSQEYEEFVKKYNSENNAPKYNFMKFNTLGFDTGIAGPAVMPMADMAMAAKPSGPLPSVDAGRDFSGTNNQVQGVDQADLLKTDGTYIYTISNKILSIILAYPANKAKVVSKVNMKDLNPSAIFIEGDYLAVFGTDYNTYSYPCPYYYPYPIYRGGPVLDAAIGIAPSVAAAAAPAARLLQTGDVTAAKIAPALDLKMINPGLIRPPYPYPPYGNCQASNPFTWIKIYDISNRGNPFLVKEYKVQGSYFNGRKLETGWVYLVATHQFSYRPRPFPWFDWGFGVQDIPFRSIFWYPITYSNPSSVNIISFSLKNPLAGEKNIVSICHEYTNIMYMSHKHIYLTTSSWENGGQFTKIRKIYVSGKYIRPFADGKVKGSVNNQFSLDQYRQFLRIATTSNAANGTSQNNVFCLDYYLSPFGELTGIAPGERIFSARYVLKRLYLVTFRQIDPFFVISLKKHRAPKILGELKIPGFSRYLHPFNDDFIIGLGRNADANGRQLGLKVSVFNVTDVANPTESASLPEISQYASSTAEWEHKAFLLSPEKNLMVIPANMDYNGTKFNGAFAIEISPTQVRLASIINHMVTPSDNYWERNVERSLYIEENLYTKSKCLLRINKNTDDFAYIKNVPIPCDQNQFTPPPIKIPLPIRIDPPFIPIPIPDPPIRTPVKPIRPIPFDPIIRIDDPILREQV